jgi:3-phenylpropionate/cinnamic acid dioxygenase small subunit
MKVTDPVTLTRLAMLQNDYIDALDRKDMAAWLDSFSSRPDASYVCISAENEVAGHPIALMLDDCHGRLEDRLVFVTRIWRGTYQEYATRHFVQLLDAEQEDSGTYRLLSNYTINYSMEPHVSGVLCMGVYRDTVVEEGGELRFLSKRAVYDTNVLPRYIVYPF